MGLTYDSLCTLSASFSTEPAVDKGLCDKLEAAKAAAAKGDTKTKNNQLTAYRQPLVFPSEVGTPIEPRNLVRHFKALLQRADLPNIRFHDLRHGFATMLINQGLHPRIVMEIVGHSQISVTMNTYGYVLPETLREAARLLDQLYTEPDEE